MDTVNSLQNVKLKNFFNKIGQNLILNVLEDSPQINSYGFNLSIKDH
jgi:hypothetical protein